MMMFGLMKLIFKATDPYFCFSAVVHIRTTGLLKAYVDFKTIGINQIRLLGSVQGDFTFRLDFLDIRLSTRRS